MRKSYIKEDLDTEGKPVFVKGEKKLMKLFISSRLLNIFSKMLKTGDFQTKTVINRIIQLSKSDDELFDFTYLDIVDGNKGNEISFMPAARAWRNMNFQSQEEANVKPPDDSPVWKASGRQTLAIGKLVTKLFDDFTDMAIQKFGNAYQAEIAALFIFDNFRLVKGEEIRKYYHENSYAIQGQGGGGLAGSCMRHPACQSFFDIYVMNPEKCNLLVLLDNNGKLLGRALVWIGLRKPTDKTFMDRIYVGKQTDEELFKKYAIERGWLYKYQQSARDPGYVEDGQLVKKSIAIALTPRSYKQYPYMDTMKYYNPDTGRLGSDQGNPVPGKRRLKLEATDGNHARVD